MILCLLQPLPQHNSDCIGSGMMDLLLRMLQVILSAKIYNANGTGSVNTNVRLFTTTAENTLGATIAHSATDGSSIAVPFNGLYFLQGSDYYTAAPASTYFGISRNATSGISNPGNLSTLAMARVSSVGSLHCISAYRIP